MRVVRGLVALILLAVALTLTASAAQQTRLKVSGAPVATAWHIDFLVDFHAGPADSAAPARWSTNGSVIDWELDVAQSSVTLNWVLSSGDFGAYTYIAGIGDGKPHRVHLDASQVGQNIVLALVVSGVTIQPIAVGDQALGSIKVLYQSPWQTIRHATFTANVDSLSAWNLF